MLIKQVTVRLQCLHIKQVKTFYTGLVFNIFIITCKLQSCNVIEIGHGSACLTCLVLHRLDIYVLRISRLISDFTRSLWIQYIFMSWDCKQTDDYIDEKRQPFPIDTKYVVVALLLVWRERNVTCTSFFTFATCTTHVRKFIILF